jgi:hypothetical protein
MTDSIWRLCESFCPDGRETHPRYFTKETLPKRQTQLSQFHLGNELLARKIRLNHFVAKLIRRGYHRRVSPISSDNNGAVMFTQALHINLAPTGGKNSGFGN